jgi:hypothetical protein
VDPYRPPSTPLPEPPSAAPRGFRLLPVVSGGFVIDYLGSNLLGILASVVATAVVVARGTPPEQAVGEAVSVLQSPAVASALMLPGAALTVLGGYVAARWAAHRFLLHAAVAGSISLVLGSLTILLGGVGPELELLVYFGFAVQVPLAIAGGWLAQRRAQRLFGPPLA